MIKIEKTEDLQNDMLILFTYAHTYVMKARITQLHKNNPTVVVCCHIIDGIKNVDYSISIMCNNRTLSLDNGHTNIFKISEEEDVPYFRRTNMSSCGVTYVSDDLNKIYKKLGLKTIALKLQNILYSEKPIFPYERGGIYCNVPFVESGNKAILPNIKKETGAYSLSEIKLSPTLSEYSGSSYFRNKEEALRTILLRCNAETNIFTFNGKNDNLFTEMFPNNYTIPIRSTNSGNMISLGFIKKSRIEYLRKKYENK